MTTKFLENVETDGVTIIINQGSKIEAQIGAKQGNVLTKEEDGLAVVLPTQSNTGSSECCFTFTGRVVPNTQDRKTDDFATEIVEFITPSGDKFYAFREVKLPETNPNTGESGGTPNEPDVHNPEGKKYRLNSDFILSGWGLKTRCVSDPVKGNVIYNKDENEYTPYSSSNDRVEIVITPAFGRGYPNDTFSVNEGDIQFKIKLPMELMPYAEINTSPSSQPKMLVERVADGFIAKSPTARFGHNELYAGIKLVFTVDQILTMFPEKVEALQDSSRESEDVIYLDVGWVEFTDLVVRNSEYGVVLPPKYKLQIENNKNPL